MSAFVVAAAQFPVFEPRDFAEFEATLSAWVREAAEAGAAVLVFPEYAALVLASIFPLELRGDLDRQVVALQSVRDDSLGSTSGSPRSMRFTCSLAASPGRSSRDRPGRRDRPECGAS